ncbi:MAG: hypothetical protein C0501_27550, partial [Isosphaera sp.]|nr:hypothetical protein [Isosphaera sp.]
MNAMMLVLAASSGQPPAGGYPAAPSYQHPVVRTQAAQPMTPPPATLPNGQLGTTAPGTPNGNGAKNGNGNGCDPCEKKEEEKPEAPEPYALMRALKGTALGDRLEKNRVSIMGWTQGSYTASTNRVSNLPVTFNDRADFWQMNQNYLRIDRAIDTSSKEFQLGGRTEWILPGTDARFTPARNLFDDQTGDYRIDLVQAYIDAFLPNLGPSGTTFRFGKFTTHCEYELIQGAETPFLSRSYLFQYNPFTHTGGWAITPLSDTWTVSNGVVLGSDNFFGAPSRPTYLGQLKWAPPEGKTSVLFNTVITNPTFDAGDNFAFYNVYNLQVNRKVTDKFTAVVDAAFSHMDGVPGVGGAANWYGGAVYGFYQVNEKLTLQ